MPTVLHRQVPKLLGVLCLLGSSTGHAEDEYERVTLTTNVLYLFVPVYRLDVELAVHERWSVSVRGGAGVSERSGERRTITELGGQGTYYVMGNASRGMQLGIDARFVTFEGDGLLLGLEGLAVGPFVGYKRVFGSGFTLGAQVGAEVTVAGRSDGPVVAYGAALIGLSFGSVNRRAEPPGATGGRPPDPDSLRDDHEGAMLGVAVGLGSGVIEGCDACKLEPGLAVDAALGWFLHRRFAVMIDSTALVALLSRSSGFGAFGFGLTSLAVQWWPHERVWLKLGVGAAQLVSTSLGATGSGVETGGGGTLAVGYELHRDRGFGMDLRLRISHGSFQPASRGFDGVDAVAALVGVYWD